MRKVAVFATLLTALNRIGQLPVMKELHGEITILEAGYRELSVKAGLICTRELMIVLLSGFMWRRYKIKWFGRVVFEAGGREII